jgi:hypothetical protein
MKSALMLIVCCTVLAGCKPGQIPPQVEEVYTCVTPVLDETFLTLKADVEKALNNEKVEWGKDLETLAKKHGLQAISCIVAIFLHPDPKPAMNTLVAPSFPKVDVTARAKEFLTSHKVTINK